MPEHDLALFPRRLRAVAHQEPTAETMWPTEYVPDVLRVLARAGRKVLQLVLVTRVGDTGEMRLHELSAYWTPDDKGTTALDHHLAALAQPDLPPHDLVTVVW